MNANTKSYKPIFVINDKTRKVKTLDLRLAVNGRNLGKEVKKAFEMAKSAGQELDLVFSHADS